MAFNSLAYQLPLTLPICKEFKYSIANWIQPELMEAIDVFLTEKTKAVHVYINKLMYMSQDDVYD